jgi:hypothetical protein
MSPEAREHSFDELTRGLASGSISRGKALRLMGAALVGGALASVGIGEAAADDCKRNGKRCKKDKQCCSGNCDDSGTCADAPPTCGAIGATCTGNTDCCSGRCASGVCAEPCPSGKVLLSNGTCARPCGDVPGACDGGCADATCSPEISGAGAFCREDGSNSGTCATTSNCPSGQFCIGGTCVVAC